jgi:hypothetical protein
VAIVPNPETRYWRTDLKRGRGIYALISNDVTKPSEYDPLIGTMENMELAELTVDLHNAVLTQYGPKHYRRALGIED